MDLYFLAPVIPHAPVMAQPARPGVKDDRHQLPLGGSVDHADLQLPILRVGLGRELESASFIGMDVGGHKMDVVKFHLLHPVQDQIPGRRLGKDQLLHADQQVGQPPAPDMALSPLPGKIQQIVADRRIQSDAAADREPAVHRLSGLIGNDPVIQTAGVLWLQQPLEAAGLAAFPEPAGI